MNATIEQRAEELAVIPAGSSLKFVDAQDFLATKYPPRKPIVEPFLCGQGICMIYGPRGVGKTHISVGLAVAIASGSGFLKWRVPEPLGVMFVDGEMPGELLQERILQSLEALGCDTVARLVVHNPDDQDRPPFNIEEPADQDELCAALTDDISVVILDNLSTLCRGGRENHADDWQETQDFMLRLRRMGKAVILIHHAGKGGQQRGTSKREDILDTVINLKRPADYAPQEGARFEVHYEKSRGFFGPDADPFLAQLEISETGQPKWGYMTLELSRSQQVARLVNEQGLTVTEIGLELGIHKSNASRALKRAKEQGLIHEEK